MNFLGKNKSFNLFIFYILLINFNILSIKKPYKVINTLYGKFTIKEPLILEMLKHPYMQRLKKVRQYGLDYYYRNSYNYTRYEHSVGVFALLKRFNAPLLEQASGLYHDISHTAFSHLGDYLFKTKIQDSYQDKIHLEFLYKAKINKLLKNYNLNVEDILHKKDNFKALEQRIPNICADRLEYNLKGGYLEKILTQQDIDQILNSLRFKDNNWYFIEVESAKKFAKVPLYLMKNVWGNEQNYLINSLGAQAINRAIELKILTLEDIKYSTDDLVWNKIHQINNSEINNSLNKIKNIDKYYKISSVKDYDLHIKNKFRGIDPLVLVNNNLIRLTQIDKEFNKEYYQAKKQIEQGWYIKFIK